MEVFMNFINAMFGSILSLDPVSAVKMVVMWAIGGTLIYLAIKKDMEPSLLLPMGFGAILVNLPLSGAIDQMHELGIEVGALSELFRAGISNELFPLLLFIGIGAMIDFGPLLANPKLLLFGAAAQFGIFMTLTLACLVNLIFPGMFSIQDAASVAIIGAADGPTSIFVGNFYGTKYLGAIIVAAYSYMALVPIIQPPIMRALTTKKERMIVMEQLRPVSKLEKIMFPIICTIIICLILPTAVPLVGMLMLGNLMKESGVVDRINKTAGNELMNIITIFLGVSVGCTTNAETFLNKNTLFIVALGLIAFCFGTAGGVLFGKIMCWATHGKVNPLIGSAGVSAVPMAARVSQKVGQQENPQNFLLMHAMGPNVAGVIGSAVAAGILINMLK